MRRRTKMGKALITVFVAAVFVLTLLAFFPAAGAEPENNEITVDSTEVVVLDTDHEGTIQHARLVTHFGVNGEGVATIVKDKNLEGDTKWQGVHGFDTPAVDGDELVWQVKVDGSGLDNVYSSTQLNKEQIKEIRTTIPLDLEYRYYLDGERVHDPAKINGRSGHFRLELHMENTSRETVPITYKDANGETQTKEVEVYMPLVILPYDWYFDCDTFFNVKADPTGVVVPLPDHFQIGWSIPLFPPASGAENTIWVEADVKDFRMPSLVVSANFIFPNTNQRDTLGETIASLKQLYGGVLRMHEGLSGGGVESIGDAPAEGTLLYGTNAILDGLNQMAAALPEASTALKGRMIPGIDQALAGIGSPDSANTLMWGIDQASRGMSQLLAGIGGPGIENTALFAMDAMASGLGEMKAGIGAADTENSLLYAVGQVSGGLEQIKSGIGSANTQDTLLYAMAAMGTGLGEMKAGIGDIRTNPSLLYAMEQMRLGLFDASAGIGSAREANTLLFALDQMRQGMERIKAGIGTESADGTLVNGIARIEQGISSGDPDNPGLKEGLQQLSAGVAEAYAATSTSGQIWQALELIRVLAFWTGPIVDQLQQGIILSTDPDNPSLHYGLGQMQSGADRMIAGIGDVSTDGTLLNGTSRIKDGLKEIGAGIGDASTDPSLLYAVAQMQGGLQMLKDGIGSAHTDGTLLFAVDAVQEGLNTMKAGIGSASINPSLLYAVSAVETGLRDIQKGIGSAGTDKTLLFAMDAMNDGLEQIKEGIGTSETANSLLFAVARVANGLEEMKTGIGAEGADNTLLFAMASVQNGLQQLRGGLASGNPNDPGLKEGLVLLSAGLDKAVAGLGNVGDGKTLVGGMTLLDDGVKQLNDGNELMLTGLYEGLSDLYLTEEQLEAIRVRGDEYDHIMGPTRGAEENSLAFIYQTPATYQYKDGSMSSIVVAVIITAAAALGILILWMLLRKRPVLG